MTTEEPQQLVEESSASASNRTSKIRSFVALLLRRRIGSQMEDKEFDEILRKKNVHIFFFSMVGLLTMAVTSAVTWYIRSSQTFPPHDAYFDDDKQSAGLQNLLLLSQAVISSTTIVSCVLITQKYRLNLMVKRAEWSGSTMYEIESTRGDATADSELQEYFNRAYSFWGTSMCWKYMAEILVHLPHPIMWMASVPSNDAQGIPNLGYKVLQAWMFLRFYLIPNILHAHSKAYQNRFEVVCSDQDLLKVGFQITKDLTLKMVFHQNTAASLVIATLMIIVGFGFSVFVFERVETLVTDATAYLRFGKREVPYWFTYVSLTTVGFGDFVPVTTAGRLVAACCIVIGIGTFILFSAVLVSRVSLSKEQKFGVEYLKTRDADEKYRTAAEVLIKTAILQYRAQKKKAKPSNYAADTVVTRHKANRMYNALKNFKVARNELESSFMQADDSVVCEKMTAVETLVSALRREIAEHQDEFSAYEEFLQHRFRNTLNHVAQYTKLGNHPV